MIAALNDIELLIFALAGHPINQTVLAKDAAGPLALQGMFKGLRVAEPLEWIALDVLDQVIDRGEDLLVFLLPMKIVLPGILGPGRPHVAFEPAFAGSTMSRSVNWPWSACLIDRNKRAALAGLLRR